MRGVDWLNWPCGQNPGRKPEGHQRALAREALSLGEQSSSCRASTLCGCRAASRTPRTLNATRVGLDRAIPFSGEPLAGLWRLGAAADDSVLANGRVRLRA
jgi:hypothetical protein